MKLLALCDSPTLTTGFACAARNFFQTWLSHNVEIHVWGIGFTGWDYKRYPKLHLYPAGGGGEWCQAYRLEKFLHFLANGGFTHVWIMQDSFLLSGGNFHQLLRKVCTDRKIRSMYYFPVDGNWDSRWASIVGAVDVPCAYTQYGKAEAERAAGRLGLQGVDCAVLGHGVDTHLFFPLKPDRRAELRAEMLKGNPLGPDDFLMINVNVHQKRKDVFRSLEILKGLRARGVPARLLMHMKQVNAMDGTDLGAMGSQLGLDPEWWGDSDKMFEGGPSRSSIEEKDMVRFYNLADLYLTTTLGEGWGLGITEALACGCPVALPDHTACAEIAEEFNRRDAETQSGESSDQTGLGRDGDRMPGFKDGGHGVTRPTPDLRMIRLPLEPGGVVLPADNSRIRPRVSLTHAVDYLEAYYHSQQWRERPPLNPAQRRWLSWPRLAFEMLQLLKNRPAQKVILGEDESSKDQVPSSREDGAARPSLPSPAFSQN